MKNVYGTFLYKEKIYSSSYEIVQQIYTYLTYVSKKINYVTEASKKINYITAARRL
jgi:hypothetical protein